MDGKADPEQQLDASWDDIQDRSYRTQITVGARDAHGLLAAMASAISEASADIESVVSAEVNPALAAHGGFVTYVGHDNEGTAFLTMGGGGHGCSMSRMTMLEGVQTTLLEQVPGLERVRDLTDHTTGENPFYH